MKMGCEKEHCQLNARRSPSGSPYLHAGPSVQCLTATEIKDALIPEKTYPKGLSRVFPRKRKAKKIFLQATCRTTLQEAHLK